MNSLMSFNNEVFGNVRVVKIGDEFYFNLSDLCFGLGYTKENSNKVKYLRKDKIENICETLEITGVSLGDTSLITITRDIDFENTYIVEEFFYDLSLESKAKNARGFRKWITKEVIPSIRQTGKFDAIENKLQQIEDKTERELKLKLYQLENVLKVSPNDMSVSILHKLTQNELQSHLYNKELANIKQEQQQLKGDVGEVKVRIDNMFVVGDRKQFTNEVKQTSRATGVKWDKIYKYTYKKLLDLYGIDLETRSKHAKQKIQDDRLKSGKKAYSPQTLDNKAGKLVIADELDVWNELGKSLSAVKNDLLNNKN